MKNEILTHLNNPAQLEQLYRNGKGPFKKAFSSMYAELQGNPAADFWHQRLNYERDEISWGTRGELLFIIIASLMAGIIAKFPAIFNISEEYFFTRNIGFIVFPFLTAYFGWKNRLETNKIIFISCVTIAGLAFINFLPDVKSDTLILSCIHLVLLLWSVLGFAFVGGRSDSGSRLTFLKYNGDLVVMSALILIAGGIMSGITIGLFEIIGLKIENFYFNYIVVFGLAAVPLVATYLTQTNPQLVGKVSPVIAKIFSPLVVVMLVIYLGAIVYSGKDPYNDREFLMIFNALLIGVMALIFFSVSGTPKLTKSRAEIWILFLLAALTIIVNGVALSAIIYRISEWGITPNRAAVLGANFLILVNLVLVTIKLFRVISKKAEPAEAGRTIAWYLPVYVVWTIVVTFIFPLIF